MFNKTTCVVVSVTAELNNNVRL